MGSRPLGGDDLPELKPAKIRVREALSSPAPGPVRDALAAVTDARARRAEEELTKPLQAYLDRAIGVVRARLKGPKGRKGTRWWDVEHKESPVTRTGPGGLIVYVKALDPGYILPDKVTDELREQLPTAALHIATDAAKDTATRLGSGDEPDLGSFDEGEIAAAVEDAVSRILGVADRHARELREAILTADKEADSLDEVIDRVEEAHRRGGNWVLMSGRTLANALANDAVYRQALRLGVTHAQWLSRRDERVRRTHAHPTGADGQVRRLGDKFQVGKFKLRFPGDPADLPASWGEIANCFIPGTSVDAPDVEASLRAPYIGEIVTLRTEAGHILTGTPNHPVLTERGWVALGKLNQFDHVVSARVGDGVQSRRQPDVQGQPALIEQVHDALAQGAFAQRVPGHAVNFHGDRPNGEVEVVAADGQLRVGRHAAFGEHVGQNYFPGRRERSHRLGGASAPHTLGIVSDAPFAGDVGSLDQRGAPGVVKVRPPLLEGVSMPAWLDAATSKPGPDGVSRDPEILGQGVFALAGPVAAHDRGVVEVETEGRMQSTATAWTHLDVAAQSVVEGGLSHAEHRGDLAQDLAGAVQLDRVVKIKRSWFSGHVYTLQTGSGMFLANNILTKNCRCGLLFRKPDKTVKRRLARVFDAAADRRAPADAMDTLRTALGKAAAAPDGRVLIPVPTGLGLPPVATLVALGRDIVGYRVMADEVDAVPGQVVTMPSVLALALAPAATTATTLAVLIPAGAVIGVAAGANGAAVILPEGAALEVLGAGVDGLRTVLTGETEPTP